MAITATARYNSGSTSSGTTFQFSPASNFTSGCHAVLFIAADNSAPNGTTNNISSVTDSLGNTWTRRQNPVYDPYSANAGVQGAIFETNMSAGALQTGTTITVTFGDTTAAKAVVLYELTPTSGYKIVYNASGDDTGGSSGGSTSVTTGTITTNNIVFGCVYIESSGAPAISWDTDTTNGSWSTRVYASVGSGISGIGVHTQYKVVTGTATQTYGITWNLSVYDTHASWIEFTEELAASGCLLRSKALSSLALRKVI